MSEKEKYTRKITTLEWDGKQWVRLDDIIEWLKQNQEAMQSEDVHELIKAAIQLKNSKQK